MIDLVESGVITNARKTLHPGKITAGFMIGSPERRSFPDGRWGDIGQRVLFLMILSLNATHCQGELGRCPYQNHRLEFLQYSRDWNRRVYDWAHDNPLVEFQ